MLNQKKMYVLKVYDVSDTLLFSENFGKLCEIEGLANKFLDDIYKLRHKDDESWDKFWENIYYARFPVDEVVKAEIFEGIKKICEGVFKIYPFGPSVNPSCFFAHEFVMNIV